MRHEIEGSVALDLSRFDRRTQVRESYREEHMEKARAQEKKKKQGRLPFKAMFKMGFVFVLTVGLAGILIYNYMRLTELSGAEAQYMSELNSLKEEQSRLQAASDAQYDLRYIEEYARVNLNMVELDNSQVTHIDFANPDRIELLRDTETEEVSVFSGFVKSFNAVVEYLN